MPEIDDSAVQKVASLARLHLEPEEREAVRQDLIRVLDHVQSLASVDVEGIEPLNNPHELSNALREDTITASLATEEVLNLAPATHDAWIAVPKVLGEGS
ncbi:MAG: Asp-tRNA(Asn)/Glu-tRNA(Gln) amidotransferase GatCAB subunit C [Phycisphaerae bacterium]|nr:Asp-tRNA(Asn)/Glu-tRNA(Gln) amidotransferase GatCAB subunit C [Phycisphaerae bacterium]